MPPIDFVTAFGRLLRDGALRDAYARNPQRMAECLRVSAADRPALLALKPEHLEIQAEVLLRKRFESVATLIPQTIANVGSSGWPLFADYARVTWPSGKPPELDDARRFLSNLAGKRLGYICIAELNRVKFATGASSFAVHLVRDAVVRNRTRSSVQILVRRCGRAWREVLLYF